MAGLANVLAITQNSIFAVSADSPVLLRRDGRSPNSRLCDGHHSGNHQYSLIWPIDRDGRSRKSSNGRQDMWLVFIVAVFVVLPVSMGVLALRRQLTSDHSDEPYAGL
jgi:hypothetical protein